jgi:hypothetical protein
MYQFISKCDALLEIHVCQVAFVPDTNICIPLEHPRFGVKKPYTKLTSAYSTSAYLAMCLLTAFDAARKETDKRQAEGRGETGSGRGLFCETSRLRHRIVDFVGSENLERSNSKTVHNRTNFFLHFMLQMVSPTTF